MRASRRYIEQGDDRAEHRARVGGQVDAQRTCTPQVNIGAL